MGNMVERTVFRRGYAALLVCAATLGLSGLQPDTALASANPQMAPHENQAKTSWYPLVAPHETAATSEATGDTNRGETHAGQIPDPHPTTVQLQIGPEVGVMTTCSGAWVGPNQILTARHCFNDFPNGPVRVFPQNSTIRGTKPIAHGMTWSAPGGNLDIAAIITQGDTSHPVAPVNTGILPPSSPLLICGQNYIINQSATTGVESTAVGGKGNFCAQVTSLDEASAARWKVPVGGSIIATLPLSIEHGDSGGPLYNQAGELVGVTSTKTNIEQSGSAVPGGHQSITFNSSISLHSVAGWLAQVGISIRSGAAPVLAPKTLPANVMRVAGSNRLATAAAVVDATPGAETLLVTTGLNAADGLAATQLSGVTSAALALSNSRDRLDAPVVALIQKYGFKRVVRVGGTVGLSDADRALIGSRGMELVELIGADRFDTAAKVARYRDQLGGAAPSYALIADGINFPDALAAGAVAGLAGGSLVLTRGGEMPGASRAYLESLAGVPLVVVGGPAERARVGAGLASSHVFVGSDRYETALQLAGGMHSPSGINGLVLVSGRNFPDALAAGAYATKQGAALLLVPPAGSKPGFLADLWDGAGRHGVIIGGHGAVSDQDAAWALSR